ncbi:MAG: beta-lactamase family protein [Gammaproteobacteria bacterium]|nr:beta-lactamase family protein [Gammaproteobacteria bacterium]
MQRLLGIDESKIRKVMQDGEIQSVSIAAGTDLNHITAIEINNDDAEKTEQVLANAIYGAASLTKPVFTYLALTLIGQENFQLNTQLHEILPFRDFCNKFKIIWDDTKENQARVQQFNPDMILSHQTGLPIGYNPASGPLKFDFEPGEGFGYSGLHMMYLQECLEIKFKLPLEALAEQYVFRLAGMTHTSFNNPIANAANSLHTTAEDYVRFCLHWMHDQNPNVQAAFKSKVSMRDDPWAVREEIPLNTLNHLDWGYGWGLEKNDEGDIISAFHTGDMGEWRAGVKLDLNDKSVKVFFSRSNFENGHLLQDQILGRSYALDYFFDKFKFARTPDELKEDWRVNPSFGIRKYWDITDDQMARSSFGQGSNTAKTLAEGQTTTAKLLSGAIKHQATSSSKQETIPKKKNDSVNDKEKSIVSKSEAKSDQATKPSYHSPSPFSTKYKPTKK